MSRRLALTALGATLFCRLPSLVRPMLEPDEATFASVATLINEGGRLYAEGGVDNKWPGIYWTYAAVFRVFGRNAMGAVHAFELLVVLATGLLCGWCARELAPEARKDRTFWLAVLWNGVFSAVFYPKMIAANTEIFMALPATAAFALTLRSLRARAPGPWLAAAGALVGVACLYKQVALVALPLPVVAALLERRPLRARLAGAAAPLGGCVAVLGAVGGWLWHQGTADDWWRWTIASLAGARLGLGTVALKAAVGVGWFACSALVVVAAAAARARRWRRGAGGERLAVTWLLLGCLGVAAGGQFFGHYFLQIVPALAVLGALELDGWVGAPPDRRRLLLVGAATAVPAALFTTAAFALDPISERPAPPPGFVETARYVREHTPPDARIFVWGLGSVFYLAADRVPATRFPAFLRRLDRGANEPPERGWDAGPDVWDTVMRDFATHPPALILDTAPADYFDFRNYPMARFPRLAAYVAEGYVKVASFQGVDVYRPRR